MRAVIAAVLFVSSLAAQGLTPATRAFTKAVPVAGYPVLTIAQFDKSTWIPTRGCYAIWGQYKTATFSEENDAMGCWSYAENRWNMILQSSSQHTVHRPQTGHQWGYQTYVPSTDTLYWVSNSGAQGVGEEMWSLYALDMAGLVSYDIPVMTTGSALTREWIGGGGTLSGYHVWDTANSRMIFFPDHNNTTGKAAVCDLAAMTCVTSATTNGPAATGATSNFQFNPDDGMSYFLPGGGTAMYRINGAAPASGWTNMTNATCVGADCVFTSGSIGHPPTPRNAPGLAYSTVDHKFLLIGGMNGSSQRLDAWTFDPAAGSGAGQWSEVCGPGATACGVAGSSYPIFTTLREGDRLVFDAADNVFIISDDNGAIWIFPLSAATANYQRTTPNYGVTAAVAPVVGPLNRTVPPIPPSSSNQQTGALDLSMDVSGGTIYLAHVEPSVPGAAGACLFPIPYIWSSAASGNWLPGGTQAAACAAIQNTSLNQPSGHPYHAKVGSTEYETHDKRNWSGLSSNGKAVIQTYNAGPGTWSGGDVGCFTAACFTANSPSNTLPQNSPRRLLNVNGSPMVLTIEGTSTFNQRSSVFVANCSSFNPCTSLSGSTPLNVLSSSNVTYADMATDGSGNIMVCWTEEVDSSGRITMTTTPQLECKYWNGSAFSVIGGGSLNRSAASWARSPSVVYSSGVWYVGYTEQTQTGLPKLYVLSCPLSGTCSQVGSGPLNINNSTGIPYHPSLASDGATLLVGWEEQSAQGQKPRGHIQKWNGAAWSSVVSGFASDTTNGSVVDVSIGVATTGTVTAAWTEASWGNLPQIYMGSWADNAVPSCVISTSSLSGGLIGLAYSQQVESSNCTSPTFTISAGSLPAGLSISSGGLITGTPLSAGSGSFTVAVADVNGNPSQALGITVGTPSLYVPLEVREQICSGCPTAGIARTDEHVVVGIPLADSAAISSISELNLIGASAAQFAIEGSWPSGNIKWLKVNAIVPGVSAGATSSLTLTNAGTGNFGGSSLATDNGSTLTVATGTSTFTIKKANYNMLDVVDVGSTHVVTSGSSQGVVLLGPDPAAAYPGNVTCSPASGGTACTTVYSCANDASSTAVIEENGPASAVVKATCTLTDSAGHTYMGVTQRLTFAKNKNYVKQVTVLRNASYGASSTFASASKGFQALELRIGVNLAGTRNYAIANHSGITSGTLSGTDYAYLYQAESNQMKSSGWCAGYPGCVVPSSLTGYAIVANGSALLTGTASQYVPGWADISNASGVGVEIGQYYLAGYGNKSLEFRSGGPDVRIGLWAGENNTTSTSTLTPNAPYYQRWPQWNTQESWMVFHDAALSSQANEHLKLQHPLMARASSPTYYNGTNALAYPLLDPTEEDAYYAATAAAASPSVTAYTATDLAFGTTGNSDAQCSFTACIWRYWRWPLGGGGSQYEARRAHMFRFLQRGWTGGYIQAKNWYRMTGDLAWPQSDGFNWRDKPSGEKIYFTFPTATSANSALAMSNQIENDQEHSNDQGAFLYYFLSGDETAKEYADAYADAFINGAAGNLYTGVNAAMWNGRSLGNVFLSLAAVYDYLASTGSSADAATILTRGQAVFNARLNPDLCAYDGYPSGCTTDKLDSIPQVGLSKVRGISNVFKETTFDSTGCSGGSAIPASSRSQATFMVGRQLEGMWEWLNTIGPSATYYNQLFDYIYGTVQWGLGEMYADNGSPTSYSFNGWRYRIVIDYASGCGFDNAVKNSHPGMWFFLKNQYDGSTDWKRKFDFTVQKALADQTKDELFQYVVGANIYALNHPRSTQLYTLPVTGFVDNGAGSYTLSWTVPPGAQSYRVKWGARRIVDWIGFNASTYSWIGDPATTQNWFAGTDAAGIPTPATPGTTQSLTIATGTAGLTAANFMVKAYATGDGISNSISSTRPVLSGKTLAGGKIVK